MIGRDGRWLRGGLLLFPYLVLYLAAWRLELSVATLRHLYLLLHGIVGVYLLASAWNARRRLEGRAWLFWLMLAAFFLRPGALLEFPLDPWEHLRRIYAWDTVTRVADHYDHEKTHYFWIWTTLSHLAPPARRLAMDLHSAFWQFALAIQFYRLSRSLGFDAAWSRLQVIGFILFFGYDLYPWFRHEAISSSLPAFIAYLEALVILLEWRDGVHRRLPLLLPLALLMRFNHIQALLLMAIAASIIFVQKHWSRLTSVARLRLSPVIALLLAGAFVGGRLAMRNGVPLFGVIDPATLTPLGTFRFLTAAEPFLLKIWIPGFFGFLAALLLLRRRPLIAGLTLGPPLLLLLPPGVMLLGNILPSPDTAPRVLFTFPPSIALIAACHDFGGDRHRRRRWWAALLFLLLLGGPPHFPFRGKLFLQWHRPDPMRTFAHLDTTASWLRTQRPELVAGRSRFMADHATEFVLATLLGHAPYSCRWVFVDRLTERNPDELLAMLRAGQFDAILLPDPRRAPPTPPSALNRYGGWQSIVDLKWLETGAMFKAGETLVREAGWRRTPAPPFMILYELPDGGGVNAAAAAAAGRSAAR